MTDTHKPNSTPEEQKIIDYKAIAIFAKNLRHIMSVIESRDYEKVNDNMKKKCKEYIDGLISEPDRQSTRWGLTDSINANLGQDPSKVNYRLKFYLGEAQLGGYFEGLLSMVDGDDHDTLNFIRDVHELICEALRVTVNTCNKSSTSNTVTSTQSQTRSLLY